MYYYDTEKYGSIDGNWMNGDRMVVNAVDFAYRFGLVKEVSNDGSNGYSFFLPNDDAVWKAAGVSWHFGFHYVDTPIGKIVTWQWYTCDMTSWPGYQGDQPTFVATSFVIYEGQYEPRKVLLFSHAEDYPTETRNNETLNRYTSRQHVVLPYNTTKAYVRFSLVREINVYYEEVTIDF